MLAYLFWHWPRTDVEPGRYADALLAFHRALSAAPPPGFRGSRVLEVAGAPWVPGPIALEDWYLVDDFTALGALNEAAISGPRRDPHDGAARMAQGGAGGVYRRVREGLATAPAQASWFGKPAEIGLPPVPGADPARRALATPAGARAGARVLPLRRDAAGARRSPQLASRAAASRLAVMYPGGLLRRTCAPWSGTSARATPAMIAVKHRVRRCKPAAIHPPQATHRFHCM